MIYNVWKELICKTIGKKKIGKWFSCFIAVFTDCLYIVNQLKRQIGINQWPVFWHLVSLMAVSDVGLSILRRFLNPKHKLQRYPCSSEICASYVLASLINHLTIWDVHVKTEAYWRKGFKTCKKGNHQNFFFGGIIFYLSML